MVLTSFQYITDNRNIRIFIYIYLTYGVGMKYYLSIISKSPNVLNFILFNGLYSVIALYTSNISSFMYPIFENSC